jgi:hypothetical protein
MSNNAKLAELRGRTDRELLVLIERELDRALTLADVAVSKESAFCGQVESIYGKVLTLLVKAPDMGQGERARIEKKMRELRLLLEQVPGAAKNSRVCSHPVEWLQHYQPAADSDHQGIQTSAYECWLARGCPIGSPAVDWLQAEEDLKNERAKAAV